tara:strand:- start:303 stop:494 length:192 start_codon:yes stop_codon:yes gene_type:complete
MGKGDKKTKRGKINSGSFGKLRPRGRNKRTATMADVPTKQTAKKTMEAGDAASSEKSLVDKKP